MCRTCEILWAGEEVCCRRVLKSSVEWFFFNNGFCIQNDYAHISQVQQHLKGVLVYISLCLTKGWTNCLHFSGFFFRNPLLSSGDVWFLRTSSSSTTKSKWFRSRGAAYRSRAAAVETFPGWFGTRFLFRIQNPSYFQIYNCKFRVQVQVSRLVWKWEEWLKEILLELKFPKRELQGIFGVWTFVKPAVKPRFIGSKCLPGKLDGRPCSRGWFAGSRVGITGAQFQVMSWEPL